MTDIPFHATRMGQRFYEHTVPELARNLSRLSDNLERLIEAAEPKEKSNEHDKDSTEETRNDLDSQGPQATHS